MNKKHKPQKHGQFVPIGDVADGLSLPGSRALTPHAATPQARHHFTTLHQVNQLIEASEAEPDLGFMARLLALCSLPRTDPKQRLQYVRRNGPYALYMTASSGNKLPFGTLPRLLLAWVCTEAVRTQRRERVWISLGLRTERHDFLTITAREVCPEPRQSIALVEGA